MSMTEDEIIEDMQEQIEYLQGVLGDLKKAKENLEQGEYKKAREHLTCDLEYHIGQECVQTWDNSLETIIKNDKKAQKIIIKLLSTIDQP